jgi:Ser/Thr protein kinase RdoA (MazF antagonist)
MGVAGEHALAVVCCWRSDQSLSYPFVMASKPEYAKRKLVYLPAHLSLLSDNSLRRKTMALMSAILASLSDVQRQAYYLDCANVALAEYDLGAISIHFIQHNAGIVYRLEAINGDACFLLKIHESAGDGLVDTPAQLTAQMAWLHALTEDGRMIVQSPIANRQGEFVTQGQLAELDRLSSICVQRWITAQHVDQWDESHARAVGVLLASLHSISEAWPGSENQEFGSYEDRDLVEAVDSLAVMVDLGLISTEQYDLIRSAGERILTMLANIERTKATFGLIHGDLHQGNVLFDSMKALVLDYGTFRSFFLYDLGVSLYHTSFDTVAIRTALVAGYDSVRPLTKTEHASLEAFMIMSAIFNLAFQATLKEHRLSPINRRNMHQLVEKFCRPFVTEDPFLFEGRPLTMADPSKPV